jgi:hypothetical protein
MAVLSRPIQSIDAAQLGCSRALFAPGMPEVIENLVVHRNKCQPRQNEIKKEREVSPGREFALFVLKVPKTLSEDQK